MVELVDTQDLKSCGRLGRAGSSPAPGTETLCKSLIYRGFFIFGGQKRGQILDYF